MKIYLDIETLPASSPEVVEQLAATIKPPATYKKPESIAEWMRDNREAALAELVAKTSFNGMLGRIACICFAIDDCDPLSVADDDEDAMLAKFREAIQDATSVAANGRDVYVPATIIGHNLVGFDLPFLKHRSIINRIKPAPQIVKAMEAKPWDACIGDTML
jgi:DNA polymerase elongation subunit (family B)